MKKAQNRICMQNQYIAKKSTKQDLQLFKKGGRHSETGILTCNQNFRMIDKHYIRGKQTIQKKQVIHMGKIEFVGESNV